MDKMDFTDLTQHIDGAPGIIVKRDPEEDDFEAILSHVSKELGLEDMIKDELTLINYGMNQERLNALHPAGGIWEFEEYQKSYFGYSSIDKYNGFYYCSNKCRQSGISTSFALKMLAAALLTPRNFEGVFVSYKKDEAINKIKYVKSFLEAMPLAFQKKILRDPLQLIEWENNNGTTARIFSHAQKPVRGTPVNRLVLDELAFYLDAALIYESCTPALSQTRGVLEITSTPFGKGGPFFEVFTDIRKYPNYYREMIYWWYSKRFIKEQYREPREFLKMALECHDMDKRTYPEGHNATEERVYKYGNSEIIKAYKNNDFDSFKQEFEGFFVDGLASFFPKDLIYTVLYKSFDDIEAMYSPRSDEFVDQITGRIMSPEEALADTIPPIHRSNNFKDMEFRRYDTIEELSIACRRGEVSGRLVAGADVGSTTNTTEIVILEEVRSEDGSMVQIERFATSLPDTPLPDQVPFFSKILDKQVQLRLAKMYIDSTGMGQHICQELKKKYGHVVHGFHFASGGVDKKEQIYKNLKARMETSTIALADDKKTLEHLYAIKRELTDSGKVVYKAEERKKHHADKAVAIALASYAGTPYSQQANTKSGGSKTVARDVAVLNDKILNGGSNQQRNLTNQPTRGKISHNIRRNRNMSIKLDPYYGD